jgi:uncharacterized protein (TIGR00725 family)
MGERRRQVAVIGAGGCAQDSEPARLAEEVGRRLAEAGVAVVCGGLGGVMEAVSRGAAEAGGTVVGIVPGHSIEEANRHCTQVVASGVGPARNLAVVGSGDVVIAVGGEWGRSRRSATRGRSAAPWSPCAAGPSRAATAWRERRA